MEAGIGLQWHPQSLPDSDQFALQLAGNLAPRLITRGISDASISHIYRRNGGAVASDAFGIGGEWRRESTPQSPKTGLHALWGPLMSYLELAFVVVCIVAVLQAVGRRLPVPMAVLQITAGAALSAVTALGDLRELSSLLFVLLVPPLLYLEAWQVPKRELLHVIRPVLGLAIGLVAVTITVVGFGLHALVPTLPLAVAFALAAALASTDTVAVSNFARRIALPPRLQILLSGEGLLNDSVALVAFKVAVAAAVTSRFSAGEAAVSLLTVSVGGLVTGAAVALVANGLRRVIMSTAPDGIRVDTTLSLLTPYAAFLAGERLGVSGVLAVVAAGLCAGMLERGHLGAATRLHGSALWSTVTLSLNGAVFVMLGLEMRHVLHRVEGYSGWSLLGYVSLLTLVLYAIRMAWAFMLAWWARRHRPALGDPLPSIGMLFVAVLCGVRGSLALSATLSIPLLTGVGSEMPGRDLAVFLAAGTIGATLLLSSLALPLLKIRPKIDDSAVMSARTVRVAMARAALKVIDTQPLAAATKVREWAMVMNRLYESRMAALESADSGTSAGHRRDLAAQRELSMVALRAQRQELDRLRGEGVLSDEVAQDVERELDLNEIALDRLDWRDAEPA